MTFPRDNARKTFSELRPLLLALRLDTQVYELDQLLSGDRVITSPDSFWYEWGKAFSSVQESAAQLLSSGQVPVPTEELQSWLEYRQETVHSRYQHNKAETEKTARGLIYRMPFMLLQIEQGRDLSELLNTSPSLRPGAGPDLLTALETTDPELLVRSLAKATAHLAETVYKPQLRILWQVLYCLKNEQEATPGPTWTCGRLMTKIQEFWTAEEDLPLEQKTIPNIQDFICWDALKVRNTAQHPEKMRYDPETKELVGQDRDQEIRWSEPDLRRILSTLFTKCKVMSLAICKVAGIFDVEPDAIGNFPPKNS